MDKKRRLIGRAYEQRIAQLVIEWLQARDDGSPSAESKFNRFVANAEEYKEYLETRQTKTGDY